MGVFVNVFENGTALLEATPQGDFSVPIEADADDFAVLEAIIALDLFEVSQALGHLFLVGLQAGATTGGVTDSASLSRKGQ